ncbi:MAG: DUF479 domain-containing protein [Sulfurovum sp.]|nr:MAG: DUF479 domain-containing protein [Sulfurovum sp.]
MNWLAHVFLSEQKIDFQIGNFLADPLKGKLWDNASADMQKGVDIHKIIDSYTDSHRVVSTSKSRLREKGLLKPVIVDLTYDYLLTKNWNMFSSIPIKEFLESFNRQAKKRSNDLPTQASELVANLADEDRLNKYHDLNQLKQAFERIDTRLSKKLLLRESAVGYFDIVNEKINDLESDFLIFFPDLCRFVKKDLDQNNLAHWKI